MKNRNIIVSLIQLLIILVLYHITSNNNLFLYALTLSLYNVFSVCFNHVSLKNSFKEIKSDYTKLKVFRYVLIDMTIVCLIFLIFSIFISDATSSILKIEETFWPYLLMGLSVFTEPFIKVILEYFNFYDKSDKFSLNLLNNYYLIESGIFLIVAILVFKILSISYILAISLLYVSKIVSFLVVMGLICFNFKRKKEKKIILKESDNLNSRKLAFKILKSNTGSSLVTLIKNSYYYISLIILYAVLSVRYSYDIGVIQRDLTFIYLYGIVVVNFMIEVVKIISNSGFNKEDSVIMKVYKTFSNMMPVVIVAVIVAPLISRLFFNSGDNSIYLMMLGVLSIFILLYDTTFMYVKNKIVVYISLILGLVFKLILIVPLINSFYRMGYNLIYGDIVSSIIGLSISTAINYIYIKLNTKKEKNFDKILGTLYENILLCIILVILQFIIPIRTENIFMVIFTLALYIFVSVMFFRIKKGRC